jgi:hypothetical protein
MVLIPEFAGDRPVQLLDGGNHFDDVSRAHRRSIDAEAAQNKDGNLPCDDLLNIVMDKDLRRPPLNLSSHH